MTLLTALRKLVKVRRYASTLERLCQFPHGGGDALSKIVTAKLRALSPLKHRGRVCAANPAAMSGQCAHGWTITHTGCSGKYGTKHRVRWLRTKTIRRFANCRSVGRGGMRGFDAWTYCHLTIGRLRDGPSSPSFKLEYRQAVDLGGFDCQLEMYRKRAARKDGKMS